MNTTIYHRKVIRNPGREILKLLLIELKEKMIDINWEHLRRTEQLLTKGRDVFG